MRKNMLPLHLVINEEQVKQLVNICRQAVESDKNYIHKLKHKEASARAFLIMAPFEGTDHAEDCITGMLESMAAERKVKEVNEFLASYNEQLETAEREHRNSLYILAQVETYAKENFIQIDEEENNQDEKETVDAGKTPANSQGAE